MPGKAGKPNESNVSLEQLIKELQAYDSTRTGKIKNEKKFKDVVNKLIAAGESAVPQLIEVLNKQEFPSFTYAAAALGEIGDVRAIKPLVKCLEDDGFSSDSKDALVKIGPACVPEIIKIVEYRIANPVEETGSLTNYSLNAIGEIRSDLSVEFLNSLLDDYMSAMPSQAFDPSKLDWPYRNVDFFHLLDCMVRQQDKRAIPHIKKAQAFFPKEYTDYLICQIAIGRIKKGRVEGYLPLEALDIAMPSGAIMDLFMGVESEREDDFDEVYGEYFDDEED